MEAGINEQPFIDAVKQRKPGAFSTLYDQYAPAFYSYIDQTLYRPDACAEILQESFCTIWTSINEYDSGKERFFTWMFKIVRKKVSNKKIDLVLHEIFACEPHLVSTITTA
jgi:DNA-directed RNA polymerase specialized sigma24 family protein